MRVGFVAAAIAGMVAVLWFATRPHGKERGGAASTVPTVAAPASGTSLRESPGAAGAVAATHSESARAAAATSAARPQAAIRLAYEAQARDAGAPAVEAHIRSIYDAEPNAQAVLRDVRCTQSVCKIDARWSAQLNRGYNAALLRVIAELSKEISLEPGGPPDGAATPIAIYVRRPVATSR